MLQAIKLQVDVADLVSTADKFAGGNEERSNNVGEFHP